MTYTQFREIVLSLPDCSDLEHFIAERGWQSLMEDYDAERIVAILTTIWAMRDNPIKGIKKAANLKNADIANRYGVTIRTIENWSTGVRKAPEYTTTMLAYCIFSDQNII